MADASLKMAGVQAILTGRIRLTGDSKTSISYNDADSGQSLPTLPNPL
jgi:hypothetical protein